MQIYHNNILPPDIVKAKQESAQRKPVPQAGQSFQEVLESRISARELQFSKHAALRLSSRDINLSDEQMNRVLSGVQTASEKGIRDSLVMVDDIALIVNIKNNTVITALGKDQSNNVFTNIDGAVIV